MWATEGFGAPVGLLRKREKMGKREKNGAKNL